MSDNKKKAEGAESAPALTPEQEIAQLKEQLAAKDAALESSKGIIAEQAQALATKEIEAASKHPVVMINKKHYKFLGKGTIIIDNKPYEAKEVMADAALLGKLLDKKSGLLKEITLKKGGK